MSDERSVSVAARAPNNPSTGLLQPSDCRPADPSTCVICLELVSEKAIALPCAHASFDFTCLGAWLQRQTSCPLCKSGVSGIKYDLETADGPKVFVLPVPRYEPALSVPPGGNTLRRRPRRRVSVLNSGDQFHCDTNTSLERRRKVYKERSYSLHVGSNPLSRYRNLNPQAFQQDETLARRAKTWIRRELQVFDFLDSASTLEPSRRRVRNAEFLGGYILAVLRSIDIRGSAGQAEELLQDFLGRDNARQFLHELENWLRSPYDQLRDWDEAVQYGNQAFPSRHHGAGSALRQLELES